MKPTTVCIAAAAILCGSLSLPAQDKDIKALAGTFADALARMSKKTAAVVDFTDLQGNVTELGRYLAEQVSVALAMTDRGIEVVDRTHLKALIQENKLSSSGLIDPATARKLGQIAGVEILVTGTLTPFGDSVQLAVKALDTNSARIISASTTDIAKTKAIEELLSRGISQSIGDAGASRLNPSVGSSSPGGIRSVSASEAEDVQFAVTGCKASGDVIVCKLLLTNRGQDRGLRITAADQGHYFVGTSMMIDDSGRTYEASDVMIGNQNGVTTLVGGVPTRVDIRFRNISPIPSHIALLDLACRIEIMTNGQQTGVQDFRVKLRDLPLTR